MKSQSLLDFIALSGGPGVINLKKKMNKGVFALDFASIQLMLLLLHVPIITQDAFEPAVSLLSK